jgi:ribosomal protein S2
MYSTITYKNLTINYFVENLLYLGHNLPVKNKNKERYYRFLCFIRNDYAIINIKYTFYYYRFVMNFLQFTFLHKNVNFTFITDKNYLSEFLNKFTNKRLNIYSRYDIIYNFNYIENTDFIIPVIAFSIIKNKELSIKFNNVCLKKGIANIGLLDSLFLESNYDLNKLLYFIPSNDDTTKALAGNFNILLKIIISSKLNKIKKLKKYCKAIK